MFQPSSYRPRFTGGHKQTLYAWARPRQFPRLPPAVERYFDVAPDARVLAHCHFRGATGETGAAPTLILLHGLEGSSTAHYMRGIADKAWAAGWDVVRLNQRNCGGTERLSRGLYHSGLTHDVRHVMLERRSNLVYEWNFVRNLKGRMRRKAGVFPGEFSLEPLKRIWTVRQFDEAYTAPHHGFRDAADYYYRASALRVADRIHVPTLIITAEDDPFVPVSTFRDPAVLANPKITVVITPHGGHCAYVERRDGDYDGYWAEREIVRFIDYQFERGRDAASAASQTPVPSLPLRA
jgi:predicted alpha/beta-fold hydrolase